MLQGPNGKPHIYKANRNPLFSQLFITYYHSAWFPESLGRGLELHVLTRRDSYTEVFMACSGLKRNS